VDPPNSNLIPVAQSGFTCSVCGQMAGLVQLFNKPPYEIVRSGLLRNLQAAVTELDYARAFSAIASGDVREIYSYDFELAPFFCPPCGKVYCASHWNIRNVFDNDDGYISLDSVRGTCPHGHERMLQD